MRKMKLREDNFTKIVQLVISRGRVWTQFCLIPNTLNNHTTVPLNWPATKMVRRAKNGDTLWDSGYLASISKGVWGSRFHNFPVIYSALTNLVLKKFLLLSNKSHPLSSESISSYYDSSGKESSRNEHTRYDHLCTWDFASTLSSLRSPLLYTCIPFNISSYHSLAPILCQAPHTYIGSLLHNLQNSNFDNTLKDLTCNGDPFAHNGEAGDLGFQINNNFVF